MEFTARFYNVVCFSWSLKSPKIKSISFFGLFTVKVNVELPTIHVEILYRKSLQTLIAKTDKATILRNTLFLYERINFVRKYLVTRTKMVAILCYERCFIVY